MAVPEALRRSAFQKFGFTDDAAHLQRVRAFVAAAVADGWSFEQATERSAAKLRRGGFTVSAVMRDNRALGIQNLYAYEAQLTAWGPDGLQVRLPETYDFAAIEAALSRCNLCGAADVRTFRYSFAGRCCGPCLPRAQAEHERPGWTR